MTDTIETSAVIVGAGPVGLFAVFELGMLDIAAHVIDILDRPGGQCTELYPEKPIYDIPGVPSVTGQGLVDNLMAQIRPFEPRFHLSEMVQTIERQPDGRFRLVTDAGTAFLTSAVIIAAGGGSFQPKKPNYPDIDLYEGSSVFYSIRHMERFRGRKVLIVGGGDSALDWVLNLEPIAARVTLMHRRDAFRAAPASVDRMRALVAEGRMDFVLGQVTRLHGAEGRLSHVTGRRDDGESYDIEAEVLLPFFGLATKLGPVADWGLNLHENRIEVSPETFETSEPGIYAIGDINVYPGKLKLILSGFHEAALMSHALARRIDPEREVLFQHSTSSESLQRRLGGL